MLGFAATIGDAQAIADVARGRATLFAIGASIALSGGAPVAGGGADVGVTGTSIVVAGGAPEGRGGADVAVTGLSLQLRGGSAEGSGGADVAVTGAPISVLGGSVDVSGGAAVAVTGAAMRLRGGTAVSSGGADVAVTGAGIRLRGGEAFVITVTPQFFDLVTRPDGAGQYLVEVTGLKGSLKSSGGAYTIGDSHAIADPVTLGTASVNEVTLQWSDRWWVGDPTEPDKANQEYEARVEVPLIMDRTINIEPERQRRVQRQVGFIEIANTDGALDSIMSAYAIDGQEVKVRYGPLNGEYKDFSTIAQMLGVKIEGGGDSIRIVVRDQSLPLSRVMQTVIYGGTGGADGTTELEGKGLPQAYGECFNVTPVLVEPSTLTYQFHDGIAQAVDEVRDKGVALSLDVSVGDVATYAALVAATIGAGKYATCLAEGLFRLGDSPAGAITADVKGDSSSSLYVDKLGDVAQRIMTRKGNIGAGRINTTSWDTLPSYKVGLYMPSGSQMTGEQALDQLVGSIGGSWGATRAGLVRAQQIVDPTAQPVQRSFDQSDILDVRRIGPAQVRWLQSVGYRKNWTIQGAQDLAGEVTDDREQLLGEPFSVKEVSDIEVKSRHVEAFTAPPIDSLLVDAADADAAATNLLAIHSADREYFEIDLKRIGYLSDTLETTQITYPRFGMEGGRTFAVVGISEDAGRDQVTLKVWG